jgi:hypothetical protein
MPTQKNSSLSIVGGGAAGTPPNLLQNEVQIFEKLTFLKTFNNNR